MVRSLLYPQVQNRYDQYPIEVQLQQFAVLVEVVAELVVVVAGLAAVAISKPSLPYL